MEPCNLVLESPPLPEGDAVESAQSVEGEAVEQVTEIKVRVSQDGTVAHLSLAATPEDPYPFTLDTIAIALESRGIVEGVLAEEVQRILDQHEYVADFLVAKGREQEEGEDARIELLFDPSPKPYAYEDTERIDWHETRLIQTVAENQPVARKIPAIEGRPGVTVTGKPIEPRKVRDVRLPTGRGTKPGEDDPNLLLAAMAGAVRLAGNEVVVDTVLAVPSDVDFSVGNINIDGGVRIGGNVLSGFRVRATGDIQIMGYVEGATIEAGGSVLVSQGVLGQANKTEIQAARDVHIKFGTNASIHAGADINIQWEALNCQLESGGTITVGASGGSRGRIVGGQALASTAIRAVDIGVESGTTTTLIVNEKTVAAYEQEVREATELIAKLRGNHAKITDEIAKLMVLRSTGDAERKEARAQLLGRMTQAATQIESEILKTEDQLEVIRSKLSTVEEPMVIVRKTLHPGVRITIGRITRMFHEQIEHVKAVLTDDRTSIITLSA